MRTTIAAAGGAAAAARGGLDGQVPQAFGEEAFATIEEWSKAADAAEEGAGAARSSSSSPGGADQMRGWRAQDAVPAVKR